MKNFFTDMIKKNPVFISATGIVPVVGTTAMGTDAAVMGLITFFVLICSGVTADVLKRYAASSADIFIRVMTAALFTTISDIAVRIISLNIHARLGIYIPLTIITALILEQAALPGKVKSFSYWKTGIYFVFAIIFIGVVREFMGHGSLFGFRALPEDWPKILMVQTPAGGFFVLAFVCLIFNGSGEKQA